MPQASPVYFQNPLFRCPVVTVDHITGVTLVARLRLESVLTAVSVHTSEKTLGASCKNYWSQWNGDPTGPQDILLVTDRTRPTYHLYVACLSREKPSVGQ